MNAPEAIRHLPNLLSLLRLVLSLPLVLMPPHSPVFYAIYIYCGLSDAIDGPLARRLGVDDATGALMDSLADFAFFLAILAILIRAFSVELAPWLPGILIIVLFRATTLIVTTLRTGTPFFIHTLANKAAGVAVFLLPPLMALGLRAVAIIPVLAVCILSALEELVIACRAESLDPDRRSLFDSDTSCSD
jgi:CDP-diacylglycerol--glycerol-3-phosphate 3-phosphatidyltransferase